MRRPRTVRHGKRSGDIRRDVSETQLAAIGSVALAYNEAEVLIDILISLALGLFANVAHEVTARINGMDGKIEIAKAAMREIGASEGFMGLLGDTLGGGSGFGRYKKYRDAVIHARILDAPAAIALTPGRRGKTDEVLLTVDALNGLFDRLVLVRLELIEACNVAIRLSTKLHLALVAKATIAISSDRDRAAQIADRSKSQLEQEIHEALSRYREHQKNRRSLPPLPEFRDGLPSQPGTEEACSRAGSTAGPPPE
jgi:hypothetical protein